VWLAIAAVMAVVAWGTPSAAAQQQQDEPTPEELWDAYPLDPEGKRTEEPAPPGTTGRDAAASSPTPATRRVTTAQQPAEDGGLPEGTVFAAVLAAFAAGLGAGLVRRQRRLAAARQAANGTPQPAPRARLVRRRPAHEAATAPPAPATREPRRRRRAGDAPPSEPVAPGRRAPAVDAPEPAPSEPRPHRPDVDVLPPEPPAREPRPRLPEIDLPPAPEPRPRFPDVDAPPPDATPVEATELASAPPRRFAGPPWPEADELWSCEIAWKPGYVRSCFRAMAAPPGAKRRQSIGESAPLKWTMMMEPEPPTPELVEAVRGLAAAIEAAGWERMDTPEEPWYALRFLWRRPGWPQRVEVVGRGAFNGMEEDTDD
jgi:hypothetical protein